MEQDTLTDVDGPKLKPSLPSRSGSSDTCPRKDIFGKYRIHEQVAVGGMGEVFLASLLSKESKDLSNRLVIKRLLPGLSEDPICQQMFQHESHLQLTLKHPNIIQGFESDIDECGRPFFTMEYIQGKSLRDILKQAKKHFVKLPSNLVLHIVEQVSEAISYIHNFKDGNNQPLQIVHSDISPHNILVSFDGSVKIIDFGIATSKINQIDFGSLSLVGKPSYMPPEQLASKAPTQQCDIFSLGVVLYESLSGRNPFAGLELARRRGAIQNLRPTPLSVFDPSLAPFDALISRCLSENPSERYQKAEELTRDLKLLRQEEPQLEISKEMLSTYVTCLFKNPARGEKTRAPKVSKETVNAPLPKPPEEPKVPERISRKMDREDIPLVSSPFDLPNGTDLDSSADIEATKLTDLKLPENPPAKEVENDIKELKLAPEDWVKTVHCDVASLYATKRLFTISGAALAAISIAAGTILITQSGGWLHFLRFVNMLRTAIG